LPVPGFAPLAGIPERTYRRRRARLRSGDVAAKGTWPSPAIDAVEAVAKYAADWPAWGHRKIAAMMRADGHVVSTSTVERALRRRGLLPPRGFRADRKTWAVLRRKVFRDPPTERNRVWQTDFSEFETPSGGIWRICAVIGYATKYCLAVTAGPTARGADALACLQQAVREAERILDLDDLRDDRARSNWPTTTPARSSTSSLHRSPSCPTAGPASAARPTELRSPATTRCPGAASTWWPTLPTPEKSSRSSLPASPGPP
jgi:putative transposase